MEWYRKAVDAAERIDPAHTSAWKLAITYAVLSIAESLAPGGPSRSNPRPCGELRCANEQCAMHLESGTPVNDHGILTLAEVAEMTRTNPATLRYWRSVGAGGPTSFKLGRRVMYRRADVEEWIAAAG